MEEEKRANAARFFISVYTEHVGKEGNAMALFLPTRYFKRVEDITKTDLAQMGIRGILLDVDNTLSSHGSPDPLPAALRWAREMREAGMKMMIVSNNTRERVAPFAEKFGLPFVSMALKPLPAGFARCRKQMNLKKREILVVGDQLFTDVLGANLGGMPSALVEPVEPEDQPLLRFKRRLEKPLLKRGKRKGG